MIRLLLLALVALIAMPARAADAPLWPGATFDPAIPTIEQVTGHAVGAELTTSGDVVRYFEALQRAAPDRVKVVDYGRSWQGRRLILAAVGSPRNMARLEEVKSGLRALADPRRTDAAAARRLIADLPVMVWLAYTVHGNEPGPSDAAMAAAHHLLAATNDARTRTILDNSVVVFVPVQNPDGRDRFVANYNAARGLQPDPDRLSAERSEPWPSGRMNHYLFDLNRDWFVQTQPETQGHVAALLEWRPQVLTDQHEMGTDQSFFFPPEAQPINPFLTSGQMATRSAMGEAIAGDFDRFGLDYFTREVFDAFYPGYGDGWPSYIGAIAMTFEQGSSRGLVARQRTGREFTYRDTVFSQFVASLATAHAAAQNRERLLTDFHQYFVTAVADGRAQGPRAWVIPAQFDQAGADRLAGVLARQGIEVTRARQAVAGCGGPHPAGSYVISAAQPLRRMARVLLDPSVPIDPEFKRRQLERRAQRLPEEIYDVTAWSLPVMFNVETIACDAAPVVQGEPVAPQLIRPLTIANPSPRVGFVVAAGSGAATRFLAGALRAGLAVRSADEGFTVGGLAYPSGSLILTNASNPAGYGDIVARLAAESGAQVTGIDTSWVTTGPSFGSARTLLVPAPRIAIAWDAPTDPYSAGHVRHLIERVYGYPATVIRTDRLRAADLSRYQVLILPEGDYGRVLGAGGVANLKSWVERGGVLIGIGRALRVLSTPEAGLLAARREEAARTKAQKEADGALPKDEAGKATAPGLLIENDAAYQRALLPENEDPASVAGVLARGVVDPEHWLSAGVKPDVNILVQGSEIYQPLALDEGRNVVRFAAADRLLIAGLLWEENRKQLAYKPFALAQEVGRGHVIGFTSDPVARGYLDGLDVLFMNAVFRGPAHADPVR